MSVLQQFSSRLKKRSTRNPYLIELFPVLEQVQQIIDEESIQYEKQTDYIIHEMVSTLRQLNAITEFDTEMVQQNIMDMFDMEFSNGKGFKNREKEYNKNESTH
jgi:predicted RNA binding protein with dsRBD fold (UPF0201 family)